ncbi:hypothetical protein D3C81_397130 [compost metagenome]|jgi:hypothetical protein
MLGFHKKLIFHRKIQAVSRFLQHINVVCFICLKGCRRAVTLFWDVSVAEIGLVAL